MRACCGHADFVLTWNWLLSVQQETLADSCKGNAAGMLECRLLWRQEHHYGVGGSSRGKHAQTSKTISIGLDRFSMVLHSSIELMLKYLPLHLHHPAYKCRQDYRHNLHLVFELPLLPSSSTLGHLHIVVQAGPCAA